MAHVITLETYGLYDESTDTQYVKEFTVNVDWLERYLANQGINLESFLTEYTWDCTDELADFAKKQGALISVKET
ncbi:MAG: hypothetical protein ACQEWV_30475 [Bacillota bacterium]